MVIEAANVLWIESDPLSGGSRSQVEFPVEVGPFFGCSSNPSIGQSIEISIECAGITFPAKRLDFHHNGVWRLNLPTAREGLGEYQNTVLCFQKTERKGHYRLWKVNLGSPLAELLREKASNQGQLLITSRITGGERECGYF